MYGLVLAGGGAKGAYQIGVWKAIKELELEVGLVVGTSVGALNGAFFAQGKFDEAKEMWENINMSTVFDADEEVLNNIDDIAQGGIGKTNIHLLSKVYDHVKSNKGLNVNPLRHLIHDHLDEELVRDNGIDFGFVTLNVNDRKPLRIFAQDIPEGELKYYLLGSALVPGFNQDEKHPLKFIDGGVYDNFPIKMAVEKGYKKIIAVQLYNRPTPKNKHAEIIYIKPSESLGNFLYFEKEKSIKNMEMGYLDALKAFKKIDGNKYFFNKNILEQDLISDWQYIHEEDKEIIKKYFSIKQDLSYRILYEKVLPKINFKLFLSKKDTYVDLLHGVLEYLLKKEKMNRITLYDPKELAMTFSSKIYPEGSFEEVLSVLLKYI